MQNLLLQFTVTTAQLSVSIQLNNSIVCLKRNSKSTFVLNLPHSQHADMVQGHLHADARIRGIRNRKMLSSLLTSIRSGGSEDTWRLPRYLL